MRTYFPNIILAGWVGLVLLLTAGRAGAMDRWAALSYMESRNNDNAIGRAGEVSRYQIQPGLWERYTGDRSLRYRRNGRVALRVAQWIMYERCAEFARRYHRSPTNFEYYVLWVAPAQIHQPSRAVVKRAWRFCHLLES